uniref:B box-type domain-containing protein n=1 Tax=Aegilops tauschii subsp. strangulata TaxID=200361 RepID=A0A453SH16_AEGTS
RRGLVFCVEDRAILCADCDEPIHSANDLTAKHSRFLLVGAKLSADPVDQEIPSPDGSSVEQDDCSASAAEEAPAVHDASHAGGGGGGGGGSSISDYLTNICPGFEVDELLFDDAAFVAVSRRRPSVYPVLSTAAYVRKLNAQTFALGRSRRGATSRCRSWTPTSSTWSPPSARGSAAHGRPTCRIRRRRPGAWRSFRPLWWPRRRRRRPSRGTCGSGTTATATATCSPCRRSRRRRPSGRGRRRSGACERACAAANHPRRRSNRASYVPVARSIHH